MKRVLVVSSTYPASQQHNVPGFVRDQLESISREHPDLDFISLSPHDYGFTNVKEGCGDRIQEHRFHYFYPRRLEKLTHFGILPTLKKNRLYYLILPFFLFFEFLAIWKCVRKYRVDLIYAHWFMPQGLLSVFVGRMLKIPVSFTSHSSDVEVMNRLPFGSFLARWALHKMARISAVSRRSYDKIRGFFSEREWDLLKEKVDVISMGTSMVPGFSSRTFNESTIKILFIGRLAEKKGLEYLIRSIKDLKSNGFDVELNIGGAGPLESTLKKLVLELSLQGNVIFHGFVSGDNKKSLLDKSDFFILPSIVTKDGDMEGLPVSLIEAMASGCICIATAISGADDIIRDGCNGYLIEPYSVESIVKAVESIVKLGPDNMVKVSDSSKNTARMYTWDVVGHKYYEFLMASLTYEKNSSVK